MRTRTLIFPLLIAGLAAALWFDARSTARELQARLDSLHSQRRELLSLRSNRLRLDAAKAELDLEVRGKERPVDAPRVAQPTLPSPPFALGEWMPYASWGNRGQSTPRATFETALWAAAGGDATTMELLLEIDPAARSKAEKLLDKLSPVARSKYVTPESLIANVTMKNVPLTAAQIAWYHESDRDHAAVGVLFGNAERSSEPVVKIPAGKQDNSPPTLSDNRTSKLALLNLRRTSSGWRLVVPVSAVDRIASEIGMPKPE